MIGDHWQEISEDTVSTLLPKKGWVRSDGIQESWNIFSQVIYTEDENRASEEFTVDVTIVGGVASKVEFQGNISKSFLLF